MARDDDDHIPSNFTARDTAKAFRDAQGRLVPQRPNALLLYVADGTPRMSDAMEAYITADSSTPGRITDGEPLPFDDLDEEQQAAALARLQVEHARLFGVLFLTDVWGLSLRATGRYLGVDHHTVVKHRGRAIALIRAWCAEERQAG